MHQALPLFSSHGHMWVSYCILSALSPERGEPCPFCLLSHHLAVMITIRLSSKLALP